MRSKALRVAVIRGIALAALLPLSFVGRAAAEDDPETSYLDRLLNDGLPPLYQDGDTVLRPVWSLQTMMAHEGHPGWGGSQALYGEVGNNWFEWGFLGGLDGTLDLVSAGLLDARLTAVASLTGGGLDAGGSNLDPRQPADVQLEDASIGWRSGKLFADSLGDDALQLSVGKQRYEIGNGFLIKDGGSDGGRRGGFWLGMRRAWQLSAVARLKTRGFTGELFFLQPNQLPSQETNLVGGNLEYAFGERATMGGSYIFGAKSDDPRRDGINVFDLRADVQPLTSVTGLRLAGEYAYENNGHQVQSAYGWYLKPYYDFRDAVPWRPLIEFRYAVFTGDEGGRGNQGFDPLFYGSSDWETWYQGEILGEYTSTNRDLISYLAGLTLHPTDALTLRSYYLHFALEDPATQLVSRSGNVRLFEVSSKRIGDEVNLIADWQATKILSFSFVFGANFPGKAIRQFFETDKVWTHYFAYANLTL